jgi:hypothetical protein
MGKYFMAILLSLLALNVFPQSVIKGRSQQGNVSIKKDASGAIAMGTEIRGKSASVPVNIVRESAIIPPQLQAENLQFVDTDGNNFINANEDARIFFTVRNTGEGPALNLEAKITEKNRVQGLDFKPKTLGTLKPGEVRTVEIPITSNLNTTNSTASFTISITETNGFGIDVGNMLVQTRAILAPLVTIAEIDYGSLPVRKNEKFDVRVIVQNTGQGIAENVNLSLSLVANVFLTNGNSSLMIGSLAPGETKEVRYTFITNNNYNLSKIVIPFILTEKYGKYAENGKSPATIPVDLQLTAVKQMEVQGEQRAVPEARPAATAVPVGTAAGSFTSDVDRDIPVITSKNAANKVALIIGNEDYSKAYNAESNVDFAARDAQIFAEYAKRVLGIQEKFVLLSVDATYVVMKSQVQRAIDIAKVVGPTAEIVFYYAGHGFPDQTTKIPYLIPVDVSASNLTSAIKLSDIYAQLGSSGASRVTVFLDACFSGGGRDMGPVNARSVRMAPSTEEGMVTGNMVVFTASTGEQTAQALKKQEHGLFTYYLLKKLKDSQGNVTYGDLFDYINKQVQLDALTENNKPQVPVFISSGLIGDKWRTWKIR